MNNEILKFIVDCISEHIGIAVKTEMKHENGEDLIVISPSDTHPNESFSVIMKFRWRSVEINLHFGNYAAPLIKQMGEATIESRQIFHTYVKALINKRAKFFMRVNGVDTSHDYYDKWPAEWKQFELILKTVPFDLQINNLDQLKSIFFDFGLSFLGMVISLIGVDESSDFLMGEPEGDSYLVLTNHYERKRLNREACIQLKGAVCSVCGFDFYKKYGAIGLGFIEIHHITPVSEIGYNYQINIQRDLEPLCSNCHSMIHRKNPPYTIIQLKEIIGDK